MFRCDTCDKSYKNKVSLNRHKKIECDFLQTCMMFKYLQAQRMSRYSSVFNCETCGKSYKNKVSLNRHRRIECGKEPNLQCSYCPYRTKHNCNLKTHIALKHSST
ncbi:hypothetical protein M8J76_015373 [Diaphorina citri]|nr:hypothetical protein M8J75_014745 [Diaphorina citri]KAI5719824.1 hypothetical protein M8J76_015373 [Diaphorina citri]KAI5720370.1 hypothetical protein M8J77_005554 [Diaphorina citri]